MPGGQLDASLPEGGGGDADPDTGGAGAAAFEQFIADLAGAVCAAQFRCCTRRDIDGLSASRYLTEPECVAYQQDQLLLVFGEVRLSLRAGRIALDESKLASCVSRVSATACGTFIMPYMDIFTQFQGCPDPFVGKVAEGERCYLRDECLPGARCIPAGAIIDYTPPTPEGLSPVPTLANAVPVTGSCVPYKKEGERCRVEVDCVPGLYCRGPAYACARPAGEGEPCSRNLSQNGLPVLPIACDDVTKSLICAGNVCGRPPREGEPCLNDGHAPCDPDPALDLACVGQQFSGGICKRAGRMGDVCGGSGVPPCTLGLACLNQIATGLGTCGPLPGIGDPCTELECARDGVCDFVKGVCVEAGSRRDGETCESDIDCASLSCFSNGPSPAVCGPPTNYGTCTGGAP